MLPGAPTDEMICPASKAVIVNLEDIGLTGEREVFSAFSLVVREHHP